MSCPTHHRALHPGRVDGLHTVCLDCGEHVIVQGCHYADGLTPEVQASEIRKRCDEALTPRDLAHVIGSVAGLLQGKAIPCSRPKDGHSCVRREDARSLTAAETKRGWARRPFYAYNAINLCNGCAAYWYASMAQIALLDVAKMEENEAAFIVARAEAAKSKSPTGEVARRPSKPEGTDRIRRRAPEETHERDRIPPGRDQRVAIRGT